MSLSREDFPTNTATHYTVPCIIIPIPRLRGERQPIELPSQYLKEFVLPELQARK